MRSTNYIINCQKNLRSNQVMVGEGGCVTGYQKPLTDRCDCLLSCQILWASFESQRCQSCGYRARRNNDNFLALGPQLRNGINNFSNRITVEFLASATGQGR